MVWINTKLYLIFLIYSALLEQFFSDLVLIKKYVKIIIVCSKILYMHLAFFPCSYELDYLVGVFLLWLLVTMDWGVFLGVFLLTLPDTLYSGSFLCAFLKWNSNFLVQDAFLPSTVFPLNILPKISICIYLF